jgi:hypothetical protein
MLEVIKPIAYYDKRRRKKFYNLDDKADDGSPSPNSHGDDNDGLRMSMTSQNVIKNNTAGNVKMTRLGFRVTVWLFFNQSVDAFLFYYALFY